MKKKLLAALLSVSMVIGLAACGSSGSGAGTGSAPAGSGDESGTSANEAAAEIDTSEHVVIKYMTTGDPPEAGTEKEASLNAMLDELNKILTEKVNAEIEIVYIPWTDYLANYNLTLARLDGSVDLVGTASDWLDAWPNAKNGAFLELSEDMLKTYAPKTWESVPADHWELCKYNGEIYLMPEDNFAQWTNHGWIYRLDWAKEAGLENGVHSWEDMSKYVLWVKENKKDLKYVWDSDGTEYAQMANGWIASHTDFVSIDGICSGAIWGGTKSDLYTVTTPVMTETDSLVEYAKLMKEWSQAGIWPTDVLNNTSGSNRDEFRVGQVGVEQHHTQTWTDLCSALPQNTIYKDDPKAETGFFYFGEETKNVVALSITHGAMAISAGSENPERALMVYDLIRNDKDCYMLFNYGIEGVSWELDENGLRKTPDSYNPDTQNINGMTNYWWGRNDNLEVKDATRNWDAIDKLYAEYDKIKIDYPYGQFVPEVDSIQAKIDNCNEQYTNYMKQISYGIYNGSAEDIVAEMQAALKSAGIDDVTAELQKQFDELYK
ncbi:ABC transporter substrate-binding protein [Butyrivibrio sp. INlla21]|uniref:ABC transporter substrate-binding protein n=1 Tax=Butyrivibrio sp. INlla21 TaxID=1520811 RepID=UPI0008E8358E|nr:ABC transporter substrate-binding protein [Butyrivibrio sp. INlla21]SFU59134.1 protein of unknown function [Butyrivibrio sp. INlla21]